MPPAKSQKAARVADTGDDNQGFVQKQKEMYKAVSELAKELLFLSDDPDLL